MISPTHRCLVAFAAALIMLTGVSLVAAQSSGPKAPAPPMRIDSIARVARLRASSVVIDADGLILTNAHVIADASAIHVLTSDGDNITATVIGSDPDLDLALVRASDARGLRAAPLVTRIASVSATGWSPLAIPLDCTTR